METHRALLLIEAVFSSGSVGHSHGPVEQRKLGKWLGVSHLLVAPHPASKNTLGTGIFDMDSPIFIDFEASSLSTDTWPIEVGIAWLEGTRVITESKLIRPRPEWDLEDWSPVSAEIHGIELSELRNAETADEVSRWLLEVVGEAVLVSDAPEFDQRWLDRLLGEAGPTIRDFDNVLWQAFSHEMGSLAPGRLHYAYQNMLRRKTAHRAGDDAAHLCYAWRAGLGRRTTSR